MVYFIQGEQTKRIKIGKTSTTVQQRLADLQVGSAEKLTCLAVIEDAEDDVPYHARFQVERVRGEWFQPSERLMAFINSLPNSFRVSQLESETYRDVRDARVPIRRVEAKRKELKDLIRANLTKSICSGDFILEIPRRKRSKRNKAREDRCRS